MFADLDRFFRVSWTHIMWIFFPQTKTIAKYVRNIMRSYLPCRGRGMRWSGASWSSVIHSGFTNMFQIKTFLPKLKTCDSTQKPYVGSFLPQKGQGLSDPLHPDLDWFFPVSRIKLKNLRLRLDLKWFIRVFQTFFSSKFFTNPKTWESTQNTIKYGSIPHRRSGDGVIGWIPISNCLV